jgi:hypothetical protein
MVFQLYLERIIVENLLSVGLINYKKDSIDTGILGIRINPDIHLAISRIEKHKTSITYYLSASRPLDNADTFTTINKLVFTKSNLSRDEYELLTGYKILEMHGDLLKREKIPTILYELYSDNDVLISGYMNPVILSSYRPYKNIKLEELNEIYRMIN